MVACSGDPCGGSPRAVGWHRPAAGAARSFQSIRTEKADRACDPTLVSETAKPTNPEPSRFRLPSHRFIEQARGRMQNRFPIMLNATGKGLERRWSMPLWRARLLPGALAGNADLALTARPDAAHPSAMGTGFLLGAGVLGWRGGPFPKGHFILFSTSGATAGNPGRAGGA